MQEKKCSVANKCGGCQYQGMEYKQQLQKKQKEEETLLKKFCKVEKIIGMENPCYYRNKVHRTFFTHSSAEGRITSFDVSL